MPGNWHVRFLEGLGGCKALWPTRRPSPEAFHHTSRPVVASYEPGERLAWCYVDETELPVPEHILPVLRD